MTLRRMFYNLTSAVLLGGAAACMSHTVDSSPARKSSVPGVGWIDFGKGEVKYAVDSWGWVSWMRRRAALRRARKICRKRGYKVIEEFVKEESKVKFSSDDLGENLERGLEHYQVHPFNHIVFECERPPKEDEEEDKAAENPGAADEKGKVPGKGKEDAE